MARAINHKGFTLIELLVVVSIIGLMSTLAYYSVLQLKTSSAVYEDVNNIASFIKKARVWAFSRKQNVEVKLSDADAGKVTISAIWLDEDGDEKGAIQAPILLNTAFQTKGLEGELYIDDRGIMNGEEITVTDDYVFDEKFFYFQPSIDSFDGQNCVAVSPLRVFLGVYQDGKCDAKEEFKE